MQGDFFSYWEQRNWFEKNDLVIIGSGITGLSAAYFIRQKFPQWKILVLEEGVLPHGATTRNAGFSCFGSLSELADDMDRNGEENMLATVKRRWSGLKALQVLHDPAAIGYENYGGYELYMPGDEAVLEQSLLQMETINDLLYRHLGLKEVFVRKPLAEAEAMGLRGVKEFLWNPYEGQLDSGRLMTSLLKLCAAADIMVLNHVRLEHFTVHDTGVTLNTSALNFTAERLLLCNNGFAAQLLPELDVKPARGQVLVTSPIAGLNLKGTFHHHQGYDYFRNIGDRVLLGGGRNLAFEEEETTQMHLSEKIQSYLKHLLDEVILPGKPYTIDYSWSGIMGVGKDKLPVIRQLQDRVWCAVRMGGMGVAIGTEVGILAADMLD